LQACTAADAAEFPRFDSFRVA